MKNILLISIFSTFFMEGCAVNQMAVNPLDAGLTAGRNRDFAEMLRHCSEAAQQVNPDPLAFKCIAEAQLNLGRTQLAEESYLTYLNRVPNDLEARFAIINIYFNSGRYAAAQAHLESVLNIQPNNLEGLYLLGESHRLLGNCDASLLNYDKALQLNPIYQAAVNGKAKAEEEICALATSRTHKKIYKHEAKTIKQKKFQGGGAALDESDW